MENSEYVKVELERYEELIIVYEQLRTLKNIIFNKLRYSEIRDRLFIEEDKEIIAYLESAWTSDFRLLLSHEKAKYEKENK